MFFTNLERYVYSNASLWTSRLTSGLSLVSSITTRLEMYKRCRELFLSNELVCTSQHHVIRGLLLAACIHNIMLYHHFYVKAADWSVNDPHPISDYQLLHQRVPSYYIMPLQATMPHTINSLTQDYTVDISRWLSDPELDFYVAEFGRTGFQGGLNWYRMFFQANETLDDLELKCSNAAGSMQAQFKVPARFIAGTKDWGTWQTPGATDKMKSLLTPDLADGDRRVVLIEGAGHWVQQEKPDDVIRELTIFVQANRAA